MRERAWEAQPEPSVEASPSARRASAPPAAAVLGLQRTAGNAAVSANLGILRQSFGFGPPIMYSPAVRQLVELQKPPQDLVKSDPMDPGSGLATTEPPGAARGAPQEGPAGARG